MPLWRPPSPPDWYLRATGDLPPPESRGVRFETESGPAYFAGRAGIRSESEPDFLRSAGEIFSTQTGDYLSRRIQVTTATDSYTVEVVQRDVGSGILQTLDAQTGGLSLASEVDADFSLIDSFAGVPSTQNESVPFIAPDSSAGAFIEEPGAEYIPPVAEALPPEAAPPEGDFTAGVGAEAGVGEPELDWWNDPNFVQPDWWVEPEPGNEAFF